MVSFDVPRNSSQRAGTIKNFSGRVTSQATIIYTVPAGIKARIFDVFIMVDAFGSGVRGGLGYKALGAGSVIVSSAVSVAIDVPTYGGNITLSATDTIHSWQNSGTNITLDYSFSVEEFSI